VLVFYVGYILDDKNTLCNGCYLNKIIGLIQNLQVIWTVFISSHVPCHKFLEYVREDSVQIPSQLAGSCATVQTGLWRRPDAPQCLDDEHRKEWRWRLLGRSTKPSRCGPVLGRIALFWKGSCRRSFGQGYLLSRHSTARVWICLELGFHKLINRWLYACYL
jgi:hypothetical protein